MPSPLRSLPEPVRRLIPEWFLQLLRALRRVLLRTRERAFPPDLQHPNRPVLDLAAPVRLLVGPANFAGQGWAWARAAEQRLVGVSATSMSLDRGLAFDCDYVVPVPVFRSLRWQKEQLEAVGSYTHVLIESERPVLGNRFGEDCRRDIATLRRMGLAVGLLSHGSDIRLGSLHRELYPHSPWLDESWEYGRRLEAQAARLAPIINAYDGPTFVSTPDLLDFAPGATWLPTVIDAAPWRSSVPVLSRDRPVVLHIPSNPHLKGSHLADPVLQRLHDAGRITYRRLSGIPPQEMPLHVADADIVLDQLVLGPYGVMSQQAMAAGRVVLSFVGPRVHATVPQPLPIVQVDPDTLEDVLLQVLDDRDTYRQVAASGPRFVDEVHDGRLSAAVLAPFLGAHLRA